MNTLAKILEGFNGTEEVAVLILNCISKSDNLVHY